ncbi:MAG: hypothetical protein WC517_01535 [Patescibacteria group bacterium]
MLFEHEKLLIPWPKGLVVRSRFTPNDNGNVSVEHYPHNVDWSYYFLTGVRFSGNKVSEEAIFEMNKVLAEVNVLCDFRPGAFGIIKDNMNASFFKPLNNRYYFTRLEFAQGYLAAAIASGHAKVDGDFVFLVC